MFLGLASSSVPQHSLTPTGASLDARRDLLGAMLGATNCPAAKMQGVLFNHLGKSGGTPMKRFLMSATGCSAETHAPCHMINEERHIPGDDARVQSGRSLVIQDDTSKDMQVTPPDTSRFFTVGLVRRPCDYLLSAWAFSSSKMHNSPTFNPANIGPHYHWGVKEPYDSKEDIARFHEWLFVISKKRDEGTSWLGGATFQSVLMKERIPNPSLVHCWVRTHSMVDDLKVCMKQYESCGGEVEPLGLSEANVTRVQEALRKADVQPTTHAACSKFFQNSTVYENIAMSEDGLISTHNLGGCCSE